MRFYVQRTVRAIFTIWVAITLTFALTRVMPGNPIARARGEIMMQQPQLTREQVNSRLQDRLDELNMDLDAPMHEQYIDYVVNLMQGNMGRSMTGDFEGEPVAELIGQWLPWTLLVTLTATILIFVIAIIWGAIIAYKEGTPLDGASSSVAILFSAIPSYVLGVALILMLGHDLGWFPTGYKMPPTETWYQPQNRWILDGLPRGLGFWVTALKHAALPIAALVLTKAGLQMLAMRGNSISVLGEDYVRVARLRGLADRRIATRYVARNAILPLYTSFLTLIGFNLGASVIIEEVFQYEAMGYYMLQGILNRNYPVMMGTFLVYTIALVLAVWVADLTYSKIDPRVKQGEASESY